MLKVACATFYDLQVNDASGVVGSRLAEIAKHRYGPRVAYSIRALEREVGPIERLGPLRLGLYPPVLFSKSLFYHRLTRRRYFPQRDRLLIKSFGRQLSKKLANSAANVVLSPVSPGSQPVAYLECRQPIVIWTDATFAGATETHPELSRERLCKETMRDALANERAALERCSLAVYMSDWAAESAIRYYKLDPAKVRVVPPGANLDSGLSAADVEAVVSRRPSSHCKLVFIATRWRPKGGDVAVEVARALNQAGLPTTLTVVGTRPDHCEPLPSYVNVAGGLRKWIPDELELFERLLREAHFLILPTRAEGAPGVMCEANAYAVPSLATDVCGVATTVIAGRNGNLFPRDAGTEAYCAFIMEHFRDYDRYLELARSSFNEYQTRLSWASAAATLRCHMLELLR